MQATHQILAEDYIRPSPLAVPILIFLVTGLGLSRNFITRGVRSGLLALLLCAFTILFFAVLIFQLTNVTFPLATTGVHLLGVVVCGVAARHWEVHHPTVPDPQMPLNL
jgi:predicted Na+-dependent transporter